MVIINPVNAIIALNFSRKFSDIMVYVKGATFQCTYLAQGGVIALNLVVLVNFN